MQSWQRAKTNDGGSQPAVKKGAGNPLKTLDFLVIPDVPMPGNGLPQVMAPATHGKSYGFLETLKILREKHSFWTAELAARKGSPRRLPVRSEELSWAPTENVGIPYVSNAFLRVQRWREVPAKKKRTRTFYRGTLANLIAIHLI